MTTPSKRTLIRLSALSGNRCAYPGCSQPIAPAKGPLIAHVCHINAASPGGPRYDVNQTEAERHGISNLLLLCPNHHALIDREPEKYNSETLRALKKAHEDAAGHAETANDERIAALLLKSLCNGSRPTNVGNIAINNSGTVQQTIVVRTGRRNVVLAPPAGVIGGDGNATRYAKYLIDRYQRFATDDPTRKAPFRYPILYSSIKREFGSDWKLVPLQNAEALFSYLKRRIDGTYIGRGRKSRGQNSYCTFEEFLTKGRGSDPL